MAQDTALLRYLLKWARRAPWSWSQRDLAFEFDWTNDYISSNATIGRTGYDMNVSGNVTTGSDGDGSYIWINWNRDVTAWTGSRAEVATTGATFTQAASFTMKIRTKPISNAPNNSSWYFSYNFVAGISSDGTSWGRFKVGIRSWATTAEIASLYTLWSVYDIYLVYDSITQKFFVYSNWILQNVWGTAIPWNFTASANLILWDNWILQWSASSSNKYIYHACIRNKALSQAEIDADIALWNTTKQDPSIVAYYVPENLQYNTQYIANPKDLSNATRTKGSGTTVTANTTVAPDWTNTADQVVWTWTSTSVSRLDAINTNISWATIASKTFIVKAFVKVAAGTAAFRLKCSHWWVADYLSSNLTATTTRQEFTFTQTFTSSTSGSWVIWWLVTDTTNTAATLEVWNVRLFLVNETLRDESPNIWWFIGRKTPLVMSARIKPNIDSANTATKQSFLQIPWHYMQLRDTNNWLHFRSETSLVARAAATWWTAVLWSWFRGKVHVLWVKYRDWTWRLYKAYVNWQLVAWAQSAYSNTIRPANVIYRTNASVWFYVTDYFSWNIRDARIYTFTWSFTDADALSIYNGWEPTSAWVTKYLHYRPPVWEVWTTTQDQSPNDRDWTLNGGVTRVFI